MVLEIYQIYLLLIIGALVGIGMSFVGQTGQGLVLPVVLIFTGDVYLAIAINLLNDFITAASVSILYIIKKQIKLRKDLYLLVIIAIGISLVGILILFTTSLGNIYGWFIPLFITLLGVIFLIRGFPDTANLKNLIKKLSFKALSKENITSNQINEFVEEKFRSEDEVKGLIPSNSRIYYFLSIGFGAFMGINSGLFGGSSGLIIVLALILIYGYPLKKGVGTALVLSVIVSGSALLFYQISGIFIFKRLFFSLEIGTYLALGSIVSGTTTSMFVQKLPVNIMGRIMGAVIMVLGIISILFYFSGY